MTVQQLGLFIRILPSALPETLIPANLTATTNDPEYRTDASWREH
jgi:hypothetical protein